MRRRTIGLVCLALIAILAAEVAAEPVSVRGLVFRDANANGRRDAGEPGLANTVVSDGLSAPTADTPSRPTWTPRSVQARRPSSS